MTATQELMKATQEAKNLENLINWRSWLPYLENLGCSYIDGKPRRFYKDKRGFYYYREVSEVELHRRA